jgi:hypothetical protein
MRQYHQIAEFHDSGERGGARLHRPRAGGAEQQQQRRAKPDGLVAQIDRRDTRQERPIPAHDVGQEIACRRQFGARSGVASEPSSSHTSGSCVA